MALTENNYNYRTKPFDGENPFDPNRVGVSYYDGLLQDPEYYRKRKGVVGSIEYMTPEEYFHACAKGFNSTFGAQVNRLSPEAVQDVKDVLDRGISLTIPYLNYSENSFAQEGRHRMKAVADIFGWDYEVPVLVVRDAPTTMEAQETTVYNALAAYPRYADKYGRNDAWFELKYNFHLTDDELIWIINRALKKGWIDEYGKEAALRILHINSIEESYQVLDELNPKLWQQDGTLRPEVHDKLIEIQDQFIEELNENNIPVAVLDAWIVGSNASYNYTEQSDLDLHIIVDSSASSCDAAVLQLLYNYFKSNFNSKYDISIHGIDVELYIEDVNSNAVSNGIYSLKQDKWIKKPIKADIPEVQIDSELLQKWTDKYNNVVAGVSAQTAQSLVNELYLLRKQSLATEGEYGQGNLIFKEFRNNGYLDKLKEIAAGDKSKELSLESKKLRGDVSMKNTLYEAIINNASREIRCYDRTTGEELCFNLEEGVKDGYTLFIKALAEKLNYEGDEFNSTVNLWEFCNNNTDVLERMFENATTVRECYDSLVQFINEGVSIKEGARLAKCLSSANIITESLKEEKVPSYSTELMQKLTDLPEGSIIEIRNTEGTVDKAFRKVSTSAGIWVCTKEGTAESAYTTDLATDYKDDNWMIDYVQAEGLHRTAIKSVDTKNIDTKNIKESLYSTLDLDDIDDIISGVLNKVKKKGCVITASAQYNSDCSKITLFVRLKNGEEHTSTVSLEALDTLEQLHRSIKNKFELMTDVCEEQSHKRVKENTSRNSTTNKLAEAPDEKKEVFVYKAMDINGNGVYKIFYDDGTYEILKGSEAYERNFNDYDKRVSMETLRHATAPPKYAIRQSRRTLGDSKSTVQQNVSMQENVSGDASKLTDVLAIAKKIGIETIQDLLDFQNRHKGEDLLVALKDYEKEFDAEGEGLKENSIKKVRFKKTDRSQKTVRENTQQSDVYYVSYKANNVYQAILAKASSQQEAKDKVQKRVPNAEILNVRVAYAGDKKPGIPVVEDTLKRNSNLSMSDYIEEGDTIYSDGQDYYITDILDTKDVDGYELALVEVSTGANIGANAPKKLVGNQNYYYFVLLNGDVEWGVCDTYEQAKEWYDGVEDGYYDYDSDHAQEWMDRHPHGWYNNEHDYGVEDGDYEEDDIYQFYHDSSEDELRKMGAFDNLNDPVHEGIVEQSANTYEVVYQPYDRYDTLAVKRKKFTSADDYQALRYVVKTIYGYDDEDIEDMELTSEDAIRDYLENVDPSGDAVVYCVYNKTLNKIILQSSFDYDNEDDINDTDTNQEQDTNDITPQSSFYSTLDSEQTKFDSGSSKVVNVIRDTGKNFGYDNARVFDLNISLFQEQVSLVPDTNYRRNNVGAAYNKDLVKTYSATSGIVYRDKQFYAYFAVKEHYNENSEILFDITLPIKGNESIDNTIQAISSKDVSKQFIADLQEYAKSICTGIAGNSVFEFSAPADIENVDKYAHQLANKHKRGSNKQLDEATEYKDKTKHGWPVLKLGRSSKWGDPIAILPRVTDKWEDYVVAWMYDVESGTWGQGHYMFDTQEEAEEYAKNEYGNNVFESVNKKQTQALKENSSKDFSVDKATKVFSYLVDKYQVDMFDFKGVPEEKVKAFWNDTLRHYGLSDVLESNMSKFYAKFGKKQSVVKESKKVRRK